MVTTDSEFHSFNRQVRRLQEDGVVEATFVPTEPFETFTERFIATGEKQHPHMVFLSQVFFNSGFKTKNLRKIVDAIPGQDTFKVIDGYHGFMAVPTNIKNIKSRVFYLDGEQLEAPTPIQRCPTKTTTYIVAGLRTESDSVALRAPGRCRRSSPASVGTRSCRALLPPLASTP